MTTLHTGGDQSHLNREVSVTDHTRSYKVCSPGPWVESGSRVQDPQSTAPLRRDSVGFDYREQLRREGAGEELECGAVDGITRCRVCV
jgi:hypothetical protein